MKKVAFVSPLSTTYVQRILRGAVSHLNAGPSVMIRDFRIPRNFRPTSSSTDVVNKLLSWDPDGVLFCAENAVLEKLLHRMSRNVPIVCTCAVKSQANVAMVGGDATTLIELAVGHFRQLGIRSPSLLLLESEEQIHGPVPRIFEEITRPRTSQAIFYESIDPELLDDPSAPVTPVPRQLAQWLRNLPKPAGVLCPFLGGGGYVIRVCEALKLRVPQDVAVIGVDDADLSLASSPTLTSMVANVEMIGAQGIEMLCKMMAGQAVPDRVRVKAHDLHVRQSTGLVRGEICDIAGALNHIDQHACKGLSVAQLVKATQHVSEITFYKHFREFTGLTPGEAIQQRQFQEAKRLLGETKLPITMVAEQSGFSSSNDFARRFRLREGKTPSEFRAQGKRRNPNQRKPVRRNNLKGLV